MTVIGLIVEYNPFHRGHEIHLSRARELAGPLGTVVCAMSGSFTQRGEPAMISKWARTEMALAMGADIVLEIPVPWVVSSAEGFAAGGVSILSAAGCGTILFGSETGDIDSLHRIAEVAHTREVEMVAHVRRKMESGQSYARGAAGFVEEVLNLDEGTIAMPNDVLGVSYMVAAKRLGVAMHFETLQRVGAAYNDEGAGVDGIASATGIRKLVSQGSPEAARALLPAGVREIFSRELKKGLGPVFLESLEVPILYAARMSSIENLRELPRVCPGMDFALHREARAASGVAGLMDALKNKSVTMARVRRVLCSLLLGIPKEAEEWTKASPGFLRLLGTSSAGRAHLAAIRKRLPLPVIVKVSGWKATVRGYNRRAAEAGLPRADGRMIGRILGLDLLSSDIWGLGVPERTLRRGGTDFETSPLRKG